MLNKGKLIEEGKRVYQQLISLLVKKDSIGKRAMAIRVAEGGGLILNAIGRRLSEERCPIAL